MTKSEDRLSEVEKAAWKSPKNATTNNNNNNNNNNNKHQGLDQFDPLRLQSYNCSRQRFFGLPIVLLPCGL